MHRITIRRVIVLGSAAIAAGGCGSDGTGPAESRTAVVTTATTGPGTDVTFGYRLYVDGVDRGSIANADTIAVEDLSDGPHLIGLGRVMGHCVVAQNPRTVTIPAAADDTVAFDVTCAESPAEPSGFLVEVVTTGEDLDPDGYVVTIDGASQPIGVNDYIGYDRIPPGQRTIGLSGLAANCTLGGAATRSLLLEPMTPTDVRFDITCGDPGSLRIEVATDGRNLDADGYLVQLGNAAPVAIPANGSFVIENVRAQPALQVTLSGAAANCGFRSLTTQEVAVPPGVETPVAVNARCVGPLAGRIVYTAGGLMQGVPRTALWSVAPDGTGREQISIVPGSYEEASVAPDGSRIVVRGHDEAIDWHLMLTDHLGAAQMQVPGGPVDLPTRPVWSPVAERILYVSGGAIHTIDPDGANHVTISTSGVVYEQADWSPDGTRIVAATENGLLVHMLANGSDIVAVPYPAGAGYPSWSPDGTRFVFRGTGIVVSGIDGSDATVVDGDPFSTRPRWSPDGTRIVFEREQVIIVMNADGSGQTPIATLGRHPVWVP